ncbi:hypothetical protein APHAL10511_002911 [Amanita phalloides]|nr:hypothetical protein APHAL10511_002911 [Amanita phalloides]
MRRIPWIGMILVLSAITLLFRFTLPIESPLLLKTGFSRNASQTVTTCNPPALEDKIETQRTPAGDTRITRVIAHIHGFTVLENVYLRNGTLFVVHNDSASLGTASQASGYPSRKSMLSKNVKLRNGTNFYPTDEEMSFVSSSDANARLGSFVQRIEGVTVLVYDSTQFLGHLYHWWGEIILGAWRIYSTIDQRQVTHPSIPHLWSDTQPMRFILPFSKNGEWRDNPGLDGPLIRAAFPSASLEESGYWADLRALGTTVVFDRLVLVNRHSAHSHPNGSLWFKMLAGAATVNVKKGFWEPMRRSLIKGVLGYVPPVGSRGAVLGHDEDEAKPLVTYVSRQGGAKFRKLANEYHESLVTSLKALESEGVIKFHEAHFERNTIREQVELAAKTTIMIGVHGNGLTHQLWMPSSPWSTVMEILRPTAYLFDYEMLARNVGHRHYAVWNDTLVTYPEGTYYGPGINYAEDFHGKDLPVWGPAVAQAIRERLAEQH